MLDTRGENDSIHPQYPPSYPEPADIVLTSGYSAGKVNVSK